MVGLLSPSPFYPLAAFLLLEMQPSESLIPSLCLAAFSTAYSHDVGICDIIDFYASLINFNFSGISPSRTFGFVAPGVLAPSGTRDNTQGSTFMNFLLQIGLSAEVRKFIVVVFTLLNFL